MSEALYGVGGLRFWSEAEIRFREAAIEQILSTARAVLRKVNVNWEFHRCEGPVLCPRSRISPAYDDSDIFVTNHEALGEAVCLAAETTDSSYAYAHHILGSVRGAKLPLCVWQSRKSFRREQNDGASAAKLRFNEFYQLELQCIYRADSAADYVSPLHDAMERRAGLLLGVPVRRVPSDRLPAYSKMTIDIEAEFRGDWKEVASMSLRTDGGVMGGHEVLVAEVAFGLDRLVEVHQAAHGLD